MVMGRNPNGRLDGLLRGALDSGWLALARLPTPLRVHLQPLFEAWQQHGLATLSEARFEPHRRGASERQSAGWAV